LNFAIDCKSLQGIIILTKKKLPKYGRISPVHVKQGTTYPNGKNVPNYHKIYQMAVRKTKRP
jgi:hypothetical protein